MKKYNVKPSKNYLPQFYKNNIPISYVDIVDNLKNLQSKLDQSIALNEELAIKYYDAQDTVFDLKDNNSISGKEYESWKNYLKKENQQNQARINKLKGE
jgi:hypothetical protein